MGPALVVLSSWYFVAQVVVSQSYQGHYSLIANQISDLGNTRACPQPPPGSCSPQHDLMNASIILLGIAMLVGSMLILREFHWRPKEERERTAARVGFPCLILAGIGAGLVGLVPENVNSHHLHTVGVALVIGFGQLAILILGLALHQMARWLRIFMLATTPVVVLAGIFIVSNHEFGVGGLLERLAQYPESLWLILFGFYISRDHYRKRALLKAVKQDPPHARPDTTCALERIMFDSARDHLTFVGMLTAFVCGAHSYYQQQCAIARQVSHHVGKLADLGYEVTLTRLPKPGRAGDDTQAT
jgi:hypothetical membrane protein